MTASARPVPARILVVDDEPDLRTLYELTLLREGYEVSSAGSLMEAKQCLEKQHFEVLITDMRLTDGLGLELIHALRSQQRNERAVVITAFGSAENAVESLKAGAFDYLTKPVNLRQFRNVIATAVQDAGTVVKPDLAGIDEKPGTAESHATKTDGDALSRLVGESLVMRQVKDRIVKVSRSMAPVLVRGESGTGKELVANAIHALSHRRAGPLIAVNCSAIPENLLETEFFGVKKGAFTGASQDRDGFFQVAQGGTLFLDEIGDLPLSMQSKLLRAIQERCIRSVGSTQEEPVDVRIVSATHKDLALEVQSGRFRQDLFYRINVIEIALPPLRQRKEDLPALCEALLRRIAHESGLPVPKLSAAALAELCSLPMAGNVRELENLLHRAFALHEGDELELDASPAASMPITMQADSAVLQDASTRPLPLPEDLQRHLDEQEREILIQTLNETGFNRTAAAARLGLSLRQIRYRIARLNIEMPQDHDSSHAPL